MVIRSADTITRAVPVLEGAGVLLNRAFGFYHTERYDPFLLLDDFRSDEPPHYLKGFPMHPHRGIQTVTYMLEGRVEHGDSLGNRGTIDPGGVQWMTSGSGIIHEEMPKGDSSGRMYGFQLWVNLPSELKMSDPGYQEFSADQIPVYTDDDGTAVRIICGEYSGVSGPVTVAGGMPLYLDLRMQPEVEKIINIPAGHNLLVYIYGGEAEFPEEKTAGNKDLVHFSDGDRLKIKSLEAGADMLVFSGCPLNEPVAWRGPIVMNTQEELNTAFSELEEGKFLRKG